VPAPPSAVVSRTTRRDIWIGARDTHQGEKTYVNWSIKHNGFYMHKVRSTYKILADKVQQQANAEDWIDWALEMMDAGFETEHLVILAGLSPHLNRFELDDIVNRALKELSLDTMTKDEMIYGYVYFLIDEALNSKISSKAALDILRKLCRDRDYEEELFPFYLLAYAQEELDELGVQLYWKDADHNNIDSIIKDQFKDWKSKYESKFANNAPA
jgi:hypothetical protein